MAPTIPMHTPSVYAPVSDALERHEYGVTKNRKAASTGGGRAWSEEEEMYLLQTRMQKMPYKHIAAHLKKTELACRLHYHQLSHGSNRRKRTTSVGSSGSSTTGHSPIIATSMPSPIHESQSRSTTPPGSAGSYASHHGGIQLPSINGTASASSPPRLPAILPKPASMTLALNAAVHSPSTSSCGYPTPLAPPLTATSLPPPSASFPSHHIQHHHSHNPTTPPLRLDCSSVPTHHQQQQQVDMARLHAVYSAHRAGFWAAVAADYGGDVSPFVLEQAWKVGLGGCLPVTPVASPDGDGRKDKTRISAILGIDADPRSPKEREIVRRMEEERR